MLRRIVRLPYFPIFLAPIILFSPALFTNRALFWGTPILQYIPWRILAWEQIKTGVLPLWNPLSGMGAPLLANYQLGLFYPPNWIYLLSVAWGGMPALAWSQGLVIVIHLIIAALGMVRIAKLLKLGVLAQTVAGLAFSLSGYLVMRASFLSMNATLAWLPWICAGVIEIYISTGKARAFLRLTLLICMQLLAGHAQVTWYSFLLAVVWLIFLIGWGDKSIIGPLPNPLTNHSDIKQHRKEQLLICMWFCLAYGTAFLLSAIQLIPTLEYLLQSQRATQVDYEYAMTYSFWPWRLLTLLAPELFGDPATGDYWGYGNYWEDAVYVGLLPFFLAFTIIVKNGAAWFRWQKNTLLANRQASVNNLVFFLTMLILFSFGLALGKNLPFYPWLYQNIPGFDMFQAPTRFTIIAVFSMSILAGMGVDAWMAGKKKNIYWMRLGIMAAVAVAIAAFVATLLLPGIKSSFFRATAQAGAVSVVIGLMALIKPAEENALSPEKVVSQTDQIKISLWSWILVTVIAIDLISTWWGQSPLANQDLFPLKSSPAQSLRSLLEGGRLYIPLNVETELKFRRFFRFDTFETNEEWGNLRAVLLPNINLLDRIPSVNNFDPLVPARYQRWMEALETGDPSLQMRLLNLMNVNVVERLNNDQVYGVNFIQVNSLPRIRWVTCGKHVSTEEAAFQLVVADGYDPEKEVVLEGLEINSHQICDQSGYTQISTISDSATQIKIKVQTSQSGYLVLADVWYPDWRVWVDGNSTQVLRANYLFRAVEVPAGDHLIRFEYRPRSFYIGASLSALSWAGLSIIWFKARNKRKQ